MVWRQGRKGEDDEQGACAGGDKEGGVPPDSGWKAREMGGERAALYRLGGLSHEGFAGGPEPDLRLPDQRLVRTGHPALERWRQDVGDARRRNDDLTAGMARGREQQVCVRRFPGNGRDADDAPVVRGTQHPWEFKRVWHLEPSLDDPDTVYAGVEDAALFKTRDGGRTWQELPGLRGHGTGPKWQPGAGGMCLHTVLLDPSNPHRMYIAISAAGAFRTDDGGKTWRPINKGLVSQYIPDPNAEIGHCVHHVAM